MSNQFLRGPEPGVPGGEPGIPGGGPGVPGTQSEESVAAVGWTSQNIRHELLAVLFYQPAGGLAPQFASEPKSNWADPAMSLFHEGYARSVPPGVNEASLSFPQPAGTYVLTRNGRKLATKLDRLGLLRDATLG